MFDLWYELIYGVLFSEGNCHLDNYYIENFMGNSVLSMPDYIATIMALICTILVYVIVCLCIYKVIKLIGRLFVRL